MSRRQAIGFTAGVIVGFLCLTSLLISISLLTNSAPVRQDNSKNQRKQNVDSRRGSFRIQQRNEFKKKSLLTVVVSSISNRKTLSFTINSTWGSSKPSGGKHSYVIFTGSEANGTEEVPGNVVELKHKDFPSLAHLSHEELAFILSQIRARYLNSYWWFLLIPANTFVSLAHMDSLLTGLDPHDVVYLGHPAKNHLGTISKYYCRAGPGILLSYGALEKIGEDVSKCIRMRTTSLTSDAALGDCMVKYLHVECYKNKVNQKNLFIYDVAGLSKEPSNLWQFKAFQDMVTLYPMRDPHQLEVMHVWNQVRDVSQDIAMARKYLRKMKESRLCTSSIPECGLQLKGKILPEMSYDYLRLNCPLYSRGYEAKLLSQLDVWDVIEDKDIYSPSSVEPRQQLEVRMTQELEYATSIAMDLIKQKSPDLDLYKVGNCYVRHKGTVGEEFIFDLELIYGGRNSWGGIIKKRIAFILPFKPKFQFLANSGVVKNLTAIPVNILVPVSPSVNNSQLYMFVKNYRRVCIKQGGNCRLIFILESHTEEESTAKKYVKYLRKKNPVLIRSTTDFVDDYDQTKMYDPGMDVLGDPELAVLADLDISMDRKFLERCRQYAVKGRQVYYPYLFRYFDMKYVYEDKYPKKPSFARKHGHWAKHSTVCLYKSDYTMLGQYQEIRKWEFMPTLPALTGGLKLVQSPDPGLTQSYVEPKCDIDIPPTELAKCLADSKDDLGDRTVLANYALALEEKCKRHKLMHQSQL